MPELLEGLSDAHRVEVLAAVAAVETADAPVCGAAFRALDDATLRGEVERALGAAGRVLLRHHDGWLSGYRDDIADRLVAEGIGVLRPTDRAVLTLVLMHCVAIPRARGEFTAEDWSQAPATTMEELERSRLTQTDIKASLRRLRAAGVLRPKLIAPGPQFQRLTGERRERLSEDLVLLCRPDGMLARVIRRRRAERFNEELADDA
jgi:hypothetical protein